MRSSRHFALVSSIALMACGGQLAQTTGVDSSDADDVGSSGDGLTDSSPLDSRSGDTSTPGCDGPVDPLLDCGATVPSIVTRTLTATRIDKVDLLIMVDNSASMEDKQAELSNRIPDLLGKLTDQTPDSTGKPIGIADLHVGVITSSLGSFGTSACDPALGAHMDDKGHLLPRLGETVATGKATALAPLAWVFDPSRAPADTYQGASGATALGKDTTAVVQSANKDGCGYEASLEAVYHFLIDPAPYATAKAACTTGGAGDSCTGSIVRSGLDAELLKERAAFLRPDSLVAVILLTDEDDASLKPWAQNWVPWARAPGTMAKGWDKCQTSVPDDQEPDDSSTLLTKYGCTSCFLNPANVNCRAPGSAWPSIRKNNDIDGLNNREAQQVAKYGFNFLWSRDRYISGFTSPTVAGSDGKTGVNPLFASGFRTPDLVLFAAIVGVPEDLVASPDHTPKLPDWAKITTPCFYKGSPCSRDWRMIESVGPRPGAPMYKGGGDLSASDPAKGGNGGDRDILDGDDLQYACIQKRTTTPTNNDCSDATSAAGNPLCLRNADGTYTQSYFKAYPGLRPLRVAQALGSSGFVASICAASYAPAVSSILDRIKAGVDHSCFASNLLADAASQVPCVVVEAFAAPVGPKGEKSCEAINAGAQGYCTPGSAPCRVGGSAFPPVSLAVAASALKLELVVKNADGSMGRETVVPTADADGNVYAISTTDGVKHLVCEELQLTGASGGSCRTDPAFSPSVGGGWCYSADKSVIGDTCVKLGAAGTIKPTGIDTPHTGSQIFSVCKSGE